MTTLIAAYDSNGLVGRCDARCYDAINPECNCICGGKNHGVGKSKAIDNTQEMAEEWIKAYSTKHEQELEFAVLPKPIQLDLFDDMQEEVNHANES